MDNWAINKPLGECSGSGKPIEPDKEYMVAGWASVEEVLDGKPIWDVVSEYLRDKKVVQLNEVNVPKLKNVEGNPGVIL